MFRKNYQNLKDSLIHLVYKLTRKCCSVFNISFSFSSDGEDYILSKIFHGIKNGKYIDIGANHPVLHSNTFLFYLSGWNGVCVDPIPSLIRKFKFYRSRDVFISAGLNANGGNKTAPFYYYKNHPDNSTFDKNRVKILESLHQRRPSKILNLPMVSVSQILDKLALDANDPTVHFLNIDVEGMEIEILTSFFKCEILPWVVCVEDLGRLAQDIPKTSIHEIMIKNGYKLAMRTFLSSIYILKFKIDNLESPFTHEWNEY